MSVYTKIKPATLLADEVYKQLVSSITDGTIDPTKRIIQDKLANEMEVSRTPVREALLRLENEGFLKRAGRSGFIVRRLSGKEAEQIYSAREAVECHSLGLLCQIEDTGQANRLAKIVETIESQPVQTISGYLDANKTIHRAFVEETDNHNLLKMFDLIWNQSTAIRLFSKFNDRDLSASLKNHMVLCEAVKKRDRQAAVELMRDHIRNGLQLQLNAIAAREADLQNGELLEKAVHEN